MQQKDLLMQAKGKAKESMNTCCNDDARCSDLCTVSAITPHSSAHSSSVFSVKHYALLQL